VLPYKIDEAPNGDARLTIRGKQYSPAEISSFILGFIKKYAEDFLGEKVNDAVITVPAYFGRTASARLPRTPARSRGLQRSADYQ